MRDFTFTMFMALYDEACEKMSLKDFLYAVDKRGEQPWMAGMTKDRLIAFLTFIFESAKNDIRYLHEQEGITLTRFAQKYGIPYPSIRNWAYGVREAPSYMVKLLTYAVLVEGSWVK